MKLQTVLLSAGLLIFIAAGCEDNPVEQYGTGLTNTIGRARVTVKTTNLQELRKSIQGFRAINERFPEDIQEIEKYTGLKLDPEKYDYDPATGNISER